MILPPGLAPAQGAPLTKGGFWSALGQIGLGLASSAAEAQKRRFAQVAPAPLPPAPAPFVGAEVAAGLKPYMPVLIVVVLAVAGVAGGLLISRLKK